MGLPPLVSYQHKFANTYLWGSYSALDGDSFVWQVNGVDNKIFETYLTAFSNYKANEFKIIVMDNAAFHSTKQIKVPPNIALIRIPPYSPELNPCKQIGQYIKHRFRNRHFPSMESLTDWFHQMVNDMQPQQIKSIVSNHNHIKIFNDAF